MATDLGRLRDGGEPAYALRQHRGWNSVCLSMLNLGPAMVRNLPSFAGGHVWCDIDDIVYANRSMLCLHTASAGEKTLRLPAPAVVTGLWTDEKTLGPVEAIAVETPPYPTRIWRTEYAPR